MGLAILLLIMPTILLTIIVTIIIGQEGKRSLSK
jgi:hypothetical protein